MVVNGFLDALTTGDAPEDAAKHDHRSPPLARFGQHRCSAAHYQRQMRMSRWSLMPPGV
jgi:hypothetical protein